MSAPPTQSDRSSRADITPPPHAKAQRPGTPTVPLMVPAAAAGRVRGSVGLGAASPAASPSVRITTGMHHGDHYDSILLGPIIDGIRESAHQRPADTPV